MANRYIVTKAPGVDGDPIPPSEPCLVIRAQDVLAPRMLDIYITLYATHAPNGGDQQVLMELNNHRAMLGRWQAELPDRVKYADRPTLEVE